MTTTATPRTHPELGVGGVRGALAVTALVGGAGMLLASVVGGSPQVSGVAAGTAMVGAFFVFGTLTTALAAAWAPGASLLVALLTYTLQAFALGLTLMAVGRADPAPASFDVRWLAGAVLAGTLAWVVALVRHALRSVAPLTAGKLRAIELARVDEEVRG